MSHIRSGHCPEATDEEVRKFKLDYVYRTPKNLVHRMSSSLDETKNEQPPRKSSTGDSKSHRTLLRKSEQTSNLKSVIKRKKLEPIEDSEPDDNGEKDEVYEDFSGDTLEEQEDVQFLVLQESQILSDSSANEFKNEQVYTIKNRNQVSSGNSLNDPVADSFTTPQPQQIVVDTRLTSKEDKFIDAVYPQYSSQSRLELIEEIIEIKRRNDLLLSRCKNYEETIHRLLN